VNGIRKPEKKSSEVSKFRFQDLKIWHSAMEIANELFDIADALEGRKLFRFAEQLRGSAMSMANNIAEGSGSTSKKEFIQFLNISRRSAFENANILIILQRRDLLKIDSLERLLDRLEHLCRQISNFQASLK
jgi:four helix bundle protein